MRLRWAPEDDGVKLPFVGPVEADETNFGENVRTWQKSGAKCLADAEPPVKPLLRASETAQRTVWLPKC